MASKLAAAKIAAWSGVRAVIAAADRPGVLGRARRRAGRHRCSPAAERLPSRKLWIAFAQGAGGRVVVDAGARRALVEQGRSLLAGRRAGREGNFEADDAVEVVGEDGRPSPRGSSATATGCGGRRARRPSSPRARRTRSSTATTSWSSSG